ncbi:hypothetical protein BN126_438 [Cronobacter sakazakii 680]|nr:hypothetical protein BN126_438 [Cronobacter sakazakii 680]
MRKTLSGTLLTTFFGNVLNGEFFRANGRGKGLMVALY